MQNQLNARMNTGNSTTVSRRSQVTLMSKRIAMTDNSNGTLMLEMKGVILSL